jgi:serine-type D-Ala-D-Ala carboxypeptidase (penicillin-binding protein 5/6)
MSPPRTARHGRPRSQRSPRLATSLPVGKLLAVVVLVLAAIVFVVVQLVRPVPAVAASAGSVTVAMPGSPASLAWPSQGEAAIGVEGTGLLGSHGAQTETPLASVTKLMTAYVVLRDHPLAKTAAGPNITVSAADVATYQTEQAQGDSVVAVEAGEQLSEMQALEGLLIPSGDNIATLLGAWDAGSETAFVAKMNETAKQLGLADTHYADASGVTPDTESTAAAQTSLAMADMSMPAFRSVVAMPQVTLPVAGLVYNVDAELGRDGIIGIKTGWTTSAGGCFVFAAESKVDGRTRTIVGAVLHQLGTAAQPSALTAAFDASTALITSAGHAIEQESVVRAGQRLGQLDAPWSQAVSLQATRPVTLMGLPGQRVVTTVRLPGRITAPVPAHRRLGSAVVQLGDEKVTVPLVTSRALPAASLGWRLTNL